MKKSILVLLVLVHWVVAKSSTWYVSPAGNDGNPGTLSAPFKTIPAAIDAANPGDIIELRAGNYVSNEIRIGKNNLTLRSYPGEWAIITASTDVEDISSCIWYNEPDVDGGLLERLEIVGGYFYGVSFETNWDWGLSYKKGVSNVTIKQCKIHDTGRDCIKIKPACNNIQILSCELFNSGIGIGNTPANGGPNAEGIDNVNGDGMIVRNCYIHNISTTGVYAKGGVQNCIIEENLIYNTLEAGILLGFYTDAEFFDQDGTNPTFYECQYSTARNNIVYNTGGAGIGFFAARNCSAYHNTVVTASSEFHAPLYFSKGDIWIDDNTTLNPPNFSLQVYNNIIVDQSGNGDEDYSVQVREGALTGSNTIDHNIYHKTTGPAQFDDGINWPAFNFQDWKSTTGMDAHSKEANPLMDGNLHLMAGSPAIDAGTTSPTSRDYDGYLRVGFSDLGADEYNNGTSLAIPPPGGVIGTGANGIVTSTLNIDAQPVIKVFPNPTTNKVQVIGLPDQATPVLTLIALEGASIRKVKNREMMVDDLPAGLYFIQINYEGHIWNSEILIARLK